MTVFAEIVIFQSTCEQEAEDCLGDEGQECCEMTCLLPDPNIVPREVSEDYFTAVFNLERMDM